MREIRIKEGAKRRMTEIEIIKIGMSFSRISRIISLIKIV